MPPVDASSTTTPNLWSTLPSTSVLASKRKETVQKGFSIVHHEPGDARLSHSAIRLFRESSDYVIGVKNCVWLAAGWRILGQMGARERPQRGRGEADGSDTGGMAPDRLNFGAYPNLHPRPCPIAHAQPTSQHSAASTVARCGEGGMVGGWHAGASPSDPLSRLVTNGEPRSRPFAHTYTPPLAVRATLTWTWLRTKVELQIEFGNGIFSNESVHYTSKLDRRSGVHKGRTQTRTRPSAACLCLRRMPCLVPMCGSRISRSLPAHVRRKQA